MYKTNEVSKITGVTNRTLHHYDKIGLLVPSKRTESNYRMYSEEDVSKLYQILIYKELEMSLIDIKRIFEEPNIDIEKMLIKQRELVIEKRYRLDRIINSIDRTIENKGDKIMSKEEFKVFGYDSVKEHKEKYEKEVQEKYSQSDAYKQSQSKTSKYSKDDWEVITDEANDIYKKLATMMDKDVQDAEVQNVVEEWRNHITKYYYNCTIEIFRGLGFMYVADERFTKNIDKFGVRLAKFLSDAIGVYCDNKEDCK